MDYKVGDKFWYIPGYRSDYAITILCTITEVDDEFRKQHKDSCLLYWLYEPVGHAVTEDELYANKQDAVDELFRRAKDVMKYEAAENLCLEGDLHKFREAKKKFIMSTWEVDNPQWIEEYPDKIKGVEWLNLQILGFADA